MRNKQKQMDNIIFTAMSKIMKSEEKAKNVYLYIFDWLLSFTKTVYKVLKLY